VNVTKHSDETRLRERTDRPWFIRPFMTSGQETEWVCSSNPECGRGLGVLLGWLMQQHSVPYRPTCLLIYDQ